MPVDPVWIHNRALGFLHALCILVQISYGGLCGRLLRIIISSFSGGDSGRTVVPNHFQYGGGRSGASLDLTGGGRRRKPGQVGEIRDSMCSLLPHELRTDRVYQP